ncbi:MAG: prephenate dehydrogenase [Gemmatimonadota bacterium]|nr:prephenate dehydrogenase [Gemmatimonadota bacterium]
MGVGLIGGSLALALRMTGMVGRILGVSSPGTIGKALEMGVIDQGFTREETGRALEQAELVIMCAPVNVIIGQMDKIAPYLKPGATVTDVGSTKRAVVRAAMSSLPEKVHFLGGHPMAGAEQTGVEAADPFLFQNAMYVICPARDNDREAADKYSRLVSATGARVLVMSPERHDSIAAAISHLPQIVAVSMMNLAADLDEKDDNTLELAAGGFRDLTRIASSPFDIWRDICSTNSDSIKELIDRFIVQLKTLRELVGDEALASSFERAARSRGLIRKNAKGFLSPVYEVVVTAPDQVGVIGRIANSLADEGINIKDIEVLKVREGEGGTIMLGFASTEDRKRAVGILKAEGFPSRFRE